MDAGIQSGRLGDRCSMRWRSIFYHRYFITSLCRQLVRKRLQLPGNDPLRVPLSIQTLSSSPLAVHNPTLSQRSR